MRAEILALLSQKLTKEELRKVENEFFDETILNGLFGAAKIIIFETEHKKGGYQPIEITEGVVNRLICYIKDRDAGWGDDCQSKLRAAQLLRRMEQRECITGSDTFYQAWQRIQKVLTKIAYED